MMHRPEERLIPEDSWKSMVRHGVTPSMNMIVNDGNDAFLFLLRGNEPAKGQLWIPGGRIRNGETTLHAIHRLMLGEVGVHPDHYDVNMVSDRHNEELFHVKHMDQAHARARYGDEVETVHYWGGVSYVTLKPGAAPEITLDDQSHAFHWLKELPKNPHEYLLWYFRVAEDAGFPVPSLPAAV
jgi:colanic acid biosynthesis protein WcaH